MTAACHQAAKHWVFRSQWFSVKPLRVKFAGERNDFRFGDGMPMRYPLFVHQNVFLIAHEKMFQRGYRGDYLDFLRPFGFVLGYLKLGSRFSINATKPSSHSGVPPAVTIERSSQSSCVSKLAPKLS
mgnify:CR=1 FL=1